MRPVLKVGLCVLLSILSVLSCKNSTVTNFYNTVAQNHNVQNSYWGTASPDTGCTPGGRTSLGIVDICGGGGAGTMNAAGAVSTAYPLCINDPAVSICTGAR